MKIYVARHGQDEDNNNGVLNGHRDTMLTDLGKHQAVMLGQSIAKSRLRHDAFDAVYVSPLTRAIQTADIATRVAGVTARVLVLPDLVERDFGVMTGQPVASIKERCAPDIIVADPVTYFLSPAGAETFPQLLERAEHILHNIAYWHTEESVLLVTHGDIGKMIYAAYYGLAWRDVLTQFHFANSELLLLSPDSPADQPHFFQHAS